MMSEEKRAVITGAAAGIGRAIARELGGSYPLILIDINEEGLAETGKMIEENGGKAAVYKADITSFEAMNELSARIEREYGPVLILVNNAGVTRDTLLVRMDPESWDMVLRVNLTGAFNSSKVFLKPMIKARWGRIVNMSSVVGQMGNVGQANYAASKAGLIGFSKSLARELGSRNITVNCIAPGFIQTPMTDDLPQEMKDAYLAQIPLKRFGAVADVTRLVRFLISDDASYITGQVIRVDGGMLM
ncbi:3-oxoacyl-[acyl-carrier-protein] reductase [candidate division WOR-3 bacterium]|nr:3-oxoacyl-[acyl-carrier-protein] reductase [candidate division WOR-3 bacterium]